VVINQQNDAQFIVLQPFFEAHQTFLGLSIIGKAAQKGLVEFNLVKFSDFVLPKERIDEPTCGPGAGMIIKPEVVEKAIAACEEKWGPGYRIFFSPQGKRLNQRLVRELAEKLISRSYGSRHSAEGLVPHHERLSTAAHPEEHAVSMRLEGHERAHLILVCPRYEGMDERVQGHYADLVVSIGDYVVMGGDLPAQVFLEGLLRFLPGVVGDPISVQEDSFSGPFLDHPEYGLPVEWKGMVIPEIVRSGNHAAINEWRLRQAAEKTVLNRFDWLRTSSLSDKEKALVAQHIPPHYIALMHAQVKIRDGTIGTTSIVSIDLHDTARSSATYGVKNFFMVCPLTDQQAIMQTFFDFWLSETGKKYNPSRYAAVSKVRPAQSLQEVIEKITELEGQKPLLIITSAQQHEHAHKIDYTCQGTVWQHKRPVLLIFGTGQGLADEVIEQGDYLLTPVGGLTDYNHLSVRSAIAIVLDRWLGLAQEAKNSQK